MAFLLAERGFAAALADDLRVVVEDQRRPNVIGDALAMTSRSRWRRHPATGAPFVSAG
jgi:hypothetical protein